jgi:hypothetical protein
VSDKRQNDPKLPLSGTSGASSRPELDATVSEATRDAKAAAEQVRAAAGTIREEAATVLSDAKEQVADVAKETRERAESFAEEQKLAGAKHAEGIARAVHRAADELQDSAPQFASYVREAGDAASRLARNMRDRSLGSLAGDVQEMARRQPMAFFGAAVLAGFAISRFIKSSSEGIHREERDQRRREDWEREGGQNSLRESWQRAPTYRDDGQRSNASSTHAPAPSTGPSATPTSTAPRTSSSSVSMPGAQGGATAQATPPQSAPPTNTPPLGTSR